MSLPKGPNLGIKLLAAGIVLGIGALIQMTQDEPMTPLLVPATILTLVAIKILWRQGSDRLPNTRMDGTSAADR